VTNERSKQDQIERADIGAHLAHHGLDVAIKRMPLGDLDVAAVLLSHAADEDVDFIVMAATATRVCASSCLAVSLAACCEL
jgi:hypothetical protein